jgi:16S rRNA (guanine527-N7)-methyltransferase
MQTLAREAQTLFNVHLSSPQTLALLTYERELMDWNRRFNLTAIRDEHSIRTKHFLDSFSCVLAWRNNVPHRLIDVGTGAGFPGIPLKILYPNMHLTLVESVGKKAKFCQHVVGVLGLQDVEVLATRIETIGQAPDHREAYDCGVARAVASLGVLSEYVLPLIKIGGMMVAQKGESGPSEAQAAEAAMRMLGGKLEQLIPVRLPAVADDRYLVVVSKVAATPPKFPRRAGTPQKQPL